jgi:hypothetical protein
MQQFKNEYQHNHICKRQNQSTKKKSKSFQLCPNNFKKGQMSVMECLHLTHDDYIGFFLSAWELLCEILRIEKNWQKSYFNLLLKNGFEPYKTPK